MKKGPVFRDNFRSRRQGMTPTDLHGRGHYFFSFWSAAYRENGLHRGRRYRTQQLDEMRAAVYAAEVLARFPQKTAPYPQAEQPLEIRCDGRANFVRRSINHGLNIANDQLIINTKADAHLVKGLPGFDATKVALDRVAFGVSQRRFNVP